MVNPADLLAALDIVGLESDDGRLFRPLPPVPDAIAARFPALAGPVEPAREFPFLAAYLDEAESFWCEGSGRALRSGPFMQVDATGAECQLEATALGDARRRMLLIEVLGSDFERLRGILQSAREQTLAMGQLEKAQAALQDARARLEQRVAERTAELVAANERLLDYQQQLRLLVAQLSIAEERERRRIATYLHDHVGQSLALVRMKLGAMGSEIGSRDGRNALAAAREHVDKTIQETRTLTFDLGSPLLYELGLESALESLTNRLREDHSIPAHFADDGQPKPLDSTARSVLYQAVRELFHNIVKHARARKVAVTMRRAGESIEIVVEDEGAGFDSSKLEFRVTKSGGFGLFNIKERLDSLGGRIDVDSRPDAGTRIVLRAPLTTVPGQP
jgi:signal transduction histidine kinase